MYYVYILSSLSTLKSYVGITDNLERRLAQHNQGLHTYTKRYLPWKLIYTETFGTRFEAREQEKYYKSTTGRRRLKSIFANLK